MNSKYKISLTVIFLLLIAGLSIFCFHLYFKLQEKNTIVDDIEEALNPSPSDTGKRWYDAYQNEHYKVIALEQSGEAFKILHRKELAEAAKTLKIKESQIDGLQKMIASIQGSFTEPVDNTQRGDTTASSFHIDPWSFFRSYTIGDKQTTHYSIKVPIKLVSYTERKHKFLGIPYGKIERFVDVSSENKNVRLDSVTSHRVLVKERRKPWSFGPAFGGGYNGREFSWWLGGSVQYGFIRW